jgi:formate hydrogenlyase subunit 3/multisubunit Na+/H+ antiporter MnhD subunit
VIPLGGALLLVVAGGVAAAALSRQPGRADPAFRLLFGSGCLLGVVRAAAVLAGGTQVEVRFPASVPGGPWVFGIDVLAALFLIAIFAAGGAAGLYGVSYLARERAHRPVGFAHLLVSLLVAAMVLVVVARAVVPFLVAWELMAITAYLLIVFEQERSDVRRAGFLYIVAAHTSLLALIALFAIWGSDASDLTFSALAERAPQLPAGGWVIALALLGFGLKAGIVPLHFWLPEAHAASPSHVSALLSGLVIKTGIYGLLRVVLLLGAAPAWSGWLLLALGAVSGILGVVWALAQHDVKRLLAFHSVENIGIILLGLGAGVLGVAYGHPAVAVLGFSGAALHTVNHALFKSLLFLGAGSVIHATGTRDIEQLGGLAGRMPGTTSAFLIGSAAIVGLPPLNGFVSEWLVFRSVLNAGAADSALRMAVFAAVALALIGGLALACFAKVVGVVFLGHARTEAARNARESTSGMVVPQFGLAAACVLIGVLPVTVVPAVLRVGALLARVPDSPALQRAAAAQSLTVFAGVLVAVALFVGFAGVWLARARSRAIADTWGCGYPATTARMQYTASSFAAPLLFAFRSVSGTRVTRTADSLATHPVDPVMDALLRPLWRVVCGAADWLRPIQRGRLSLYLVYMVATVLVLLAYLLLAGRP